MLLPAGVPHVPRDGAGDRVAARPDRPDEGRQRGAHRAEPHGLQTLGPVHPVPRMRDGVPIGSPVREADRGRDDRGRAPQEARPTTQDGGKGFAERHTAPPGQAGPHGGRAAAIPAFGPPAGRPRNAGAQAPLAQAGRPGGLGAVRLRRAIQGEGPGDSRARGAPGEGGQLLSGCVMPLVNGPEMRAVARVLARNGCEIVVPREQVCCGAIHSHVGDMDTARGMARRNVEVFEAAGVDAVVTASAGCGARMKEYDELLRGRRRVRVALGGPRTQGEGRARAPGGAALHSIPRAAWTSGSRTRTLATWSTRSGVTEAPRQLLRSIPGLELVEMDGASRCCGSRRLLRNHAARILAPAPRLEDERRGRYGSPHSRNRKPRLPHPAPARRPPLRQGHPGTLHHRPAGRLLCRGVFGIERTQPHPLHEASATPPAT